MITSGFTYVAFLLFLAAVLVAGEKYTGWKLFKYVPAIVLVYLFNMLFCTVNLWDLEATSGTYSALKNNLLYAMIFVMLLRCDFRKMARLGGRMIAIFMGAALSILVGFILAYVVFKGALGVESWKALCALCASWIGGSANMAAMEAAFTIPQGDYACALIVDDVYYALWIALLLIAVPFASKWNKHMKADTSKLDAIAAAANQELAANQKKSTDSSSLVILLGISLMVSALCQKAGAALAFSVIDKGTMTVVIVTVLGLLAALSPMSKMGGVEELSNMYLYVVISLLASRASLSELLDAPLWLVAGLMVLVIHIVVMYLLSKAFHWDLCMVSTASLANIGGSASAPIVAAAYDGSYAGIGVLMGVVGAAVGNLLGLACGYIMSALA